MDTDTPHVIQTRTKHLSWYLNTHPIIQAPIGNVAGDRASWTWVVPPSADLESELAVEEERIQRYGGNDPAEPPPKDFDRRPSSTFTRDHRSRRFSTATRASTSALVYPEEITWDGPDDPTNPQNWSDGRKRVITAMIVAMTVCATFASSAPGVAARFIDADLGNSREVGDLITSMFLLGYVLGVRGFFSAYMHICLHCCASRYSGVPEANYWGGVPYLSSPCRYTLYFILA